MLDNFDIILKSPNDEWARELYERFRAGCSIDLVDADNVLFSSDISGNNMARFILERNVYSTPSYRSLQNAEQNGLLHIASGEYNGRITPL
jgi:hypothetical protein